ncbi:RidA family protein [Pusillimonas sp. TS35]|uniref:RidA family protein n=1 Tax=Paracandidimonas lactea TaxID=2895524 RepID=UPI00136F44F6|nr:RidA family protein [Paracandidimonas lactea]MYN13864.1 RidA family protein [Pusillimonas sp. TS35]
MANLLRIDTNERMSRVVIHGNTVSVAGLTAHDGTLDIKGQTRQVLERIDGYLLQAGTDWDHIVSAQVWLKDIARDYSGMNEVWEAWFKPGSTPARATCQAELAQQDRLVEIIITAALP